VHLTDAEQRVLRIALSRLSEKGAWSLDDLKLELEELILDEAPIEIAGFSGPEIEQILLDDDPPAAERGRLEPKPHAKAIAQEGDVFVRGRHVFVCGDATKSEVLATVMGLDESARLILTDVP
jgi:hypothetical protein